MLVGGKGTGGKEARGARAMGDRGGGGGGGGGGGEALSFTHVPSHQTQRPDFPRPPPPSSSRIAIILGTSPSPRPLPSPGRREGEKLEIGEEEEEIRVCGSSAVSFELEGKKMYVIWTLLSGGLGNPRKYFHVGLRHKCKSIF